jgi:hypothetical protein
MAQVSEVSAEAIEPAVMLSTKEKLCRGWRPSFEGSGFPGQLEAIAIQGWGAIVENRPSADNMRNAVAVVKMSYDEDAQNSI